MALMSDVCENASGPSDVDRLLIDEQFFEGERHGLGPPTLLVSMSLAA